MATWKATNKTPTPYLAKKLANIRVSITPFSSSYELRRMFTTSKFKSMGIREIDLSWHGILKPGFWRIFNLLVTSCFINHHKKTKYPHPMFACLVCHSRNNRKTRKILLPWWSTGSVWFNSWFDNSTH